MKNPSSQASFIIYKGWKCVVLWVIPPPYSCKAYTVGWVNTLRFIKCVGQLEAHTADLFKTFFAKVQR